MTTIPCSNEKKKIMRVTLKAFDLVFREYIAQNQRTNTRSSEAGTQRDVVSSSKRKSFCTLFVRLAVCQFTHICLVLVHIYVNKINNPSPV